MKLLCTALTHVGRRRNNEDALICDDSLGLFAVADGMGGYEGGEVASRLAVQTLGEFVRRNRIDADVTWPYKLDSELTLNENMAATAVRLAHEEIARHRHGQLDQMGSTLAMMLLGDGHRAVVAHIGDSRVYRLRSGALDQLTVDYSMYEELARQGTDDLPAREHFPYHNVITRALGISGSADVSTVELAVGDIYLLCTDGLTDAVPHSFITQVMAEKPLDRACRELVEAAYENGGRDNITAVLFRRET